MLLSKNRVIRRRAVVGLLVAASLTLLTVSYREGSTGVVGSMQRGVVELTAPFASVAHRVTRPFVDGWHWTTGLIDARNQTAELKTLKVKLGLATARNEQLTAQNATLAALAHWGEQNPSFKFVSGSVIVQYHPLFSSTVMIGIGSDKGVHTNDAVVAPSSDGGGLVGLVTEVTGNTATVQLLLDRSTGVTAEVLGEQGALGTIVAAPGTPGELNMLQVPNAVRVRKDDTVVTTGSGGRLNSLYPDGLAIGRVSQATPFENGPDMQIQVTPFVDFTNLDGVIVLETHH
ncbi:MAG TPA: rod shape-determining protein MreC [Gaiellales bacterium]|jgi:rod shape-determining protein MreC